MLLKPVQHVDKKNSLIYSSTFICYVLAIVFSDGHQGVPRPSVKLSQSSKLAAEAVLFYICRYRVGLPY